MSEHSLMLPPSSAACWINCSASSQAKIRYPNESGEAADEGTAVHFIVEQCLVQGIEPTMFLGRTITVKRDRVERKFVVTKDIAVNAALDVNFTREIVRTPGESHVEAHVDLTHIAPDFFGKCDLWHLGDDGVLTVKDTKNGRIDVPVLYDDGTLNWQMVIYAIGILEHLSRQMHPARMPTHVRLVIVQPNSIQPGPRIKYHTVTTDTIMRLEPLVRQAAHDVLHNPQFRYGPHCKYCPALGQCPETQTEIKALAPVLLAGSLTPENAGRILARKDLLEKIIKEAEKVAFEHLMRGGAVPGYKLVTSRKHRAWSDEDAAYDAASGIPGALKVVTPAQMEKLPGGKEIADKYAIIPPGEPQVAPASDKRPLYVQRSADQIFGSGG